MGPGDSLHRATPPCSLDAQQDHPEGHRELQNYARSEGISADIEDEIIMTQDTSTYYVWVGGSCDYGLKEPTHEARAEISLLNLCLARRRKAKPMTTISNISFIAF